MANSLNREELIQLLSNLGAENDEVVLSAAREIDSKVNEAGTNWNDLLVPDSDAESSTSESDEPVSSSGSKSPPPDDQEALRLIEGLLAKSDLSDDMREELEMYRDDINEGDFTDMDRKYVQSLHDRLTKA